MKKYKVEIIGFFMNRKDNKSYQKKCGEFEIEASTKNSAFNKAINSPAVLPEDEIILKEIKK